MSSTNFVDGQTVIEADWLNDVDEAVYTTLGTKVDAANPVVTGSIIVPKTSGIGILVDTAAPTYAWHDLLGRISVRGAGGQDPGFNVYRTSIRQFQFAVGDECWVEYHIPHDYAPNTDVYVHMHWSLTDTTVETVTWGVSASYAKGHGDGVFPAVVTTTVAEASTGVAYTHFITEVQITGVGLLDKSLLEPDGLILVRTYLSANSGATEPFLHFTDLHYQSTNIGSKQKSPPFYT